ncbi:MAG: hypothetical protein AAFQ64_14930 [Pseudomonadota bacterium]
MSLLTPFTEFSKDQVSPVTDAFATALNAMLAAGPAQQESKPQLVLMGDLLDLQFSDRAHATQSGLSFLKAINRDAGFAPEMIATPGNHDHALWTDARLGLQHGDQLRSIPPGERVIYRKITPAFTPEPDADSRLLTKIAQDAGFDSVDLRYPNIGFGDRDKAVVIHHGHFVESPYKLISALYDQAMDRPRQFLTAEEIASENAGWLDFFWATLGETGMGDDFYTFYQNMLTVGGFRTISADWSVKIAEKLSEMLPMSGNLTLRETLRIVARVGIDAGIGPFLDSERMAVVETLTTDGWDGVQWYLDGVVRSQNNAELRPNFPLGDQTQTEDSRVRDLTFIFGHTHKPFADRMVSDASPNPVKVFNTGGWTVNGPRFDTAAGAGMVLIDDNLDAVLVRVLGTPQKGTIRPAFVEPIGGVAEGENQFMIDVARWLAASSDAWEALASEAEKAYQVRQRYLLKLTNPDSAKGRVA